MDSELLDHLARRGRLQDLYEPDIDPLMPTNMKDENGDTGDDTSLTINDFQNYENAIHSHFEDEMDEAVKEMEKKGAVSVPKFKQDLWTLVNILGYASFCKQTWTLNMLQKANRAPRPVNRKEMEGAWYRLLMKAYKSWDPRTKSRSKSKGPALKLKQKVLQKGMYQIYDGSNRFWRKKKRTHPELDVDHVTFWPEPNSFCDDDFTYGPDFCAPPVALSDIGSDEIQDEAEIMDIEKEMGVDGREIGEDQGINDDDGDVTVIKNQFEKMQIDQ